LPRPSSSGAAAGAWGLSAYPVSAAYRASVERSLGGPLDVSVLSELRSAGAVQLLRHLSGMKRDRALVLVEDDSGQPIVPVLRFLLSISRCVSLGVAAPDGSVSPFTRAGGVLDAVRLFTGSVLGVAAAARCAIELAYLRRRKPLRPGIEAVRRVASLKPNLWFGLKAGGSVGHVAGVANALARASESVDMIAVERPPLLDGRVHHHAVRHAGAFGYPYELNYYRYQGIFARRSRQVFRGRRPDMVYHRVSLANYSGLRLARDLRVPLVIEFNGSEVWVSKHWGRPLLLPNLAEAAEDISLAHADLIVTVSEVLEQQLVEKGIDRRRILVHPTCVDPERFDPAAFTAASRRDLLARYGIPESALVCGFIGTFGAWHGVTLLAEAIRTLVDKEADWLRRNGVHFLLVGDGLLMPKVREILSGCAAFATLTGLVPQEDAPQYLAAADVLLSPHVPNPDGSRFFGSPTKLFEYMAMARGIVASDLDQIGDVLRRSYRAAALPAGPCDEDDDRLAVLTTPGSADELIAGLRFLIERDDYRRILGRNARREVLRHYTWDRNVHELLSRLADVSRIAR
jgi:glycosyltransferase involved in cell wall biosynthesis